MPKFKITDPSSGKSFIVTGDTAPTEAEANQIFGASGAPTPPSEQSPGLGGSLIDAARSVPGGLAKGLTSLASTGGDLRETLASGARAIGGDTAGNLTNLGLGVLPGFNTPTSGQLNDAISAPTGGFYQPKTGLGRFAENAASFVPTAFGGEGSIAARVAGRVLAPALGATIGGDIASTDGKPSPVGSMLGALAGGIAGTRNPAAIARTLGKAITNPTTALLGLITGVGQNAVRGAYAAGRAGDAASDAFVGNMRQTTPWDQVVTDAKAALGNMRADRNAAYRSGQVDLSKDATVLDFKPIDDAVANASNVKSFKGQNISPKTADVQTEISDAIDHWRSLDPAEYHTPEGIDALKQQIGEIKDVQPFGSPSRVVANQIYGAIRDTIAKQAPTYDTMMGDYGKASDLISNIQGELSLNPKANVNTALRKLQSVMRDNVNTSWGNRAGHAQTLQDAGATTLLPSLAGQALSSTLPRGLARYGDASIAVAAALAHNPATLAALPLASPRLVGEGAHALGRIVSRLGIPASSAIPAALPMGRISPPNIAALLASPYIASRVGLFGGGQPTSAMQPQ